jgi:hypothetical protein
MSQKDVLEGRNEAVGANKEFRSQQLRTLSEMGWLSLQSHDFQDRMIAIGRWTAVAQGKALYTVGEPPDAVFGCVFHEHSATDSMNIRPPVPR